MTISGITGSNWSAQALLKTDSRQNLPGSSFAELMTAKADSASPTSSAAQEFTDYMQKTPAQRMVSSWLSQRGISDADFAAMSASDKEKLIQEMKQDLEARAKEKASQSGSDSTSKIDILV